MLTSVCVWGGQASGVISYHKATSCPPSSHTRKHLVLGGWGMHMVADTAEIQLLSSGQVRVLGGAGPDLESLQAPRAALCLF